MNARSQKVTVIRRMMGGKTYTVSTRATPLRAALYKNREEARPAVSQGVVEAAQRLLERKTPSIKQFGMAISRACIAAGIPTFSPGRLRHSVATWAIKSGGGPGAGRRVLEPQVPAHDAALLRDARSPGEGACVALRGPSRFRPGPLVRREPTGSSHGRDQRTRGSRGILYFSITLPSSDAAELTYVYTEPPNESARMHDSERLAEFKDRLKGRIILDLKVQQYWQRDELVAPANVIFVQIGEQQWLRFFFDGCAFFWRDVEMPDEPVLMPELEGRTALVESGSHLTGRTITGAEISDLGDPRTLRIELSGGAHLELHHQNDTNSLRLR